MTTTLPDGSLVNPTPPAACGGRVVTVAAAIEAILGALAAARPDRATAASGLIHVYTLAGDAVPWLNLFYEFGGIGARAGADGPDATGCFFLGGRSVIPQVEPLEAAYPLVVRAARLRPDSGGPGRFRGGLGVETVVEALADSRCTVRGDRIALPPPGRDGGDPGRPGAYLVERRDGTTELLAPKQAGVRLRAGDRLVVRTSGGGGLGAPDERDPNLVLADVAAGRVSPAGATGDYGVVLTADPRAVDGPATEALRRRRRDDARRVS